MSPEREKGDFATGSSLLDNTKSELPLQGKRERRPILQKGCDFMFKHKTKIGAVILAMVTATALLSGCGADTAKEYDKHLKPETTVSVDKDADKVDDKKDSKESDKKADKADKQDSKDSAEKPADKDNGKKEDKPAESKPSKPANSGAVNKPSTSKPSKPSNPAPAPSKPAPSKPNKPAPSEPAKPSKPAHQHDWQPVYTTVHHEAQYRNEPVYKDEIVYEDRPIYKWQAYWTCNECNQRFENEFDVADHAMYECGGGWTAHKEKIQTGTEQVQVGTNKVQIGTNPVLVKEAWDEQVKTGSVCTKCNAHK